MENAAAGIPVPSSLVHFVIIDLMVEAQAKETGSFLFHASMRN